MHFLDDAKPGVHGSLTQPTRGDFSATRRVLVIEDMPALANVLKESIQLVYPTTDVFATLDFHSALRCVEQQQFLMILVDTSFLISFARKQKELSPDALIDLIKRKQPSAQVVLMSGLAKEDVGESILYVNSLPFLQKPFVFTELFGIINRVLNNNAKSSGNNGKWGGMGSCPS